MSLSTGEKVTHIVRMNISTQRQFRAIDCTKTVDQDSESKGIKLIFDHHFILKCSL